MLVVLDSDFLSSFLKIEQVSLIRELYQVELLRVPAQVPDVEPDPWDQP